MILLKIGPTRTVLIPTHHASGVDIQRCYQAGHAHRSLQNYQGVIGRADKDWLTKHSPSLLFGGNLRQD